MKIIIKETQYHKLMFRRRLKDFDDHISSLYVVKYPCMCLNENEFLDVVIDESTEELMNMEVGVDFIKMVKEYIKTEKGEQLKKFWIQLCEKSDDLNESDVEKYKQKQFSHFASGNRLKKIYPMIDYIDVYKVPELSDTVVIKIYLNDPEITSENMFEKGLDPHYLVDYHIQRYFPYFGLSSKGNIGFVVVGTDGETISSWFK